MLNMSPVSHTFGCRRVCEDCSMFCSRRGGGNNNNNDDVNAKYGKISRGPIVGSVSFKFFSYVDLFQGFHEKKNVS